jgi:hypothetical protein
MPGIAQLWLTQEELDALLRAGGTLGTAVAPTLWKSIAPKIRNARNGLGCPVSREPGNM